jgi:tetratricopeptide (TPR) repeat protein
MHSIGACPFIQVCSRASQAKALAAVLCLATFAKAADCNTGLSTQEKLAEFKRLDSAAEAAIQQHRPADAIKMYEEAACLVPGSARAFYGLGVAQAAAGEFRQAREALRTSDRLQPTTGMPLLMQERVNFSLQDMDALKENLREAAARFPRDAQLHTALARVLAEQNLLVLAVAEAMRSQKAADDANARLQLAVLENTVGAYDDALREAVSVEQRADQAKELRGAAAGIAGLSYESLHKPEDGVRYLQEAIDLNPAQENNYLALADLLEQMQKYPEAVNALENGRRHLPESGAILLALGADLVRTKRYQEGSAVLKLLLRNAPETPDAYISLADAARKTGDQSQELAELRDLSRVKPDYPMLDLLIARCLLSKEPVNHTQVLAQLQLAANRDPNDSEVFFLESKSYIALSRYDDAVYALKKAISLRPTEAGLYYQLARVYQKLGKAELAQHQFELVKHLDTSAAK